jgi:hypothetical protein
VSGGSRNGDERCTGYRKERRARCRQARGKVAENVKNKFKKVLERNYGFSIICKINGILGGNGAAQGEEDPPLDSNDVTLFKYAPLTSRDVGRSFSMYKKILSDNPRSFSFENLKMHLVIQCNAARHARVALYSSVALSFNLKIDAF